MNSIRIFIKNSLSTYPLVANSIIYGTLCTAAEFSQQTLAKKIMDDPPSPYDKGTITRYTLYGTFIGGPLISVWYNKFLDKKFQGTTGKVVFKKLLMDQCTFTPVLLLVFYVSMSVMERKPDVLEEARNKFFQTFRNSCIFWVPAQTVNFLFVPPIYRVAYIGVCSFAWINVLCWMKRQKIKE